MNNLNKKQKIVAVILIAIIIGSIVYYVYVKDSNYEEISDYNMLEVSNSTNQTEENNEYSDSTILVHISGAINKEGVIELKAKSRIADAIDKAEGLKENANIESINLAYVLEDGMKIHIPSNEEKAKENEDNTTQTDETDKYVNTESGIETNSNTISTTPNNANSTNNKSTIKVNINTANQTELETLPGIGPSTALKIITYRQEHGKFKSIEDIKNVSGIGDSKFSNIKEYIKV